MAVAAVFSTAMARISIATSLLALVLLSSWSNVIDAGRSLEVIPGGGTNITFQENFTLGWSGGGEGFKITSNAPVTILRYNDQQYLDGETPIGKREAYVYVKTNCPDVYKGNGIRIRYEKDENGYVTGVRIVAGQQPRGGARRNSRRFLTPSKFKASWDYTSFWCRSFEYEKGQVAEAPILIAEELLEELEGEVEDVAEKETSIEETSEKQEEKETSTEETSEKQEEKETSTEETSEKEEEKETSTEETSEKQEEKETSIEETSEKQEEKEPSTEETSEKEEEKETSTEETSEKQEEKEPPTEETSEKEEEKESSTEETGEKQEEKESSTEETREKEEEKEASTEETREKETMETYFKDLPRDDTTKEEEKEPSTEETGEKEEEKDTSPEEKSEKEDENEPSTEETNEKEDAKKESEAEAQPEIVYPEPKLLGGDRRELVGWEDQGGDAVNEDKADDEGDEEDEQDGDANTKAVNEGDDKDKQDGDAVSNTKADDEGDEKEDEQDGDAVSNTKADDEGDEKVDEQDGDAVSNTKTGDKGDDKDLKTSLTENVSSATNVKLPSRTKANRRGRCSINVEILLDGCDKNVIVNSKKVRVIDVVLEDESNSKNSKDECVTDYEAMLTFPQRTPDEPTRMENTRNTYKVSSLPSGQCVRAIEGRPFLDSSSENPILAQPVVSTSIASAWGSVSDNSDSTTCVVDTNVSDNVTSHHPMASHAASQDIVSTWTQRGLGEHASVASFAAFTLALMTNNAPPELVRDALRAALDEVNHAKVSFQVASLFAGMAVEPSALPPSSHHFGQDLTALALGAAKEGCITETLSVLDAIAESNGYEKTYSEDLTESDVTMLRDHLSVIAEDEGRHSALAWRTVRWVCEVDRNACEAVKAEAFGSANLASASDRFESRELREAWRAIYEVLVPFVTGEDRSSATVVCNKDEIGNKSQEEELAASIVRAVVC